MKILITEKLSKHPNGLGWRSKVESIVTIEKPSHACGIYAENLLAANGARGVCYCGYKESEHIKQD
jgi:hypothetical protein